MSETNVQLFPGVFRSTVGGANPGFFLHSDGRVGIGNTAPEDRPAWDTDPASTAKNKLNVTGHTHITGSLNVTGHLYGDGSNLTGTALPWQQATSNPGTDIKYEGGRVGIGGEPSSTNILKVHGTVEATSFSGSIQSSDVNGLQNSATIEATTTNAANKIVLRDGVGDIAARYFYGSYVNVSHNTETRNSDTIFYSSTDNFIRKTNASGMRSSLGLANSATIEATTANTASRIALRDSSGDIQTRLFRSSYTDETHGIGSSAFAYRVNNGTDNYIRFCSDMGQLRSRLVCADRHGNSGYNFYTSTIYIGGSTSRGLRSVTGNYGTVQTTGEGNGGWEGYSIDGRYVFMSASNNSCGIYNDLDNNWMIYCYRNNYTKLYYAGAERFKTGNPNFISDAGLRIYGAEELYDYPDASADYWTNWNQIQADAPYYQYGLYVNNAIRAPIYVVLSDRRIKKDFLEIDDTIALDKLRQLKPTSYKYKDKMRRTTDRVLGFIAQEVAEVLPDAVSKTNAVIPNIQIEASVKKIDEEKFEFTLKEPHIVTVGSKLELKAPKFSHKDVEVISVTDDTTFTGTAKDFDIEKVGDRVIVYGEYVNDFHNLDKNAIFTVATAALQEVDRQLQAEKEKVKSLEERLAALEAIVLNQ